MSENDSETGWTFGESPDTGEVAIGGEIDFTVTPKMRERLAAFIENSRGDVVLRLANLEYIDSSGLAALIEARKILAKRGRGIRVADASDQVRKLFHLTQIGDLFGL